MEDTRRDKNGESFPKKITYAEGYPHKRITLEDCVAKLKKCAPFAAEAFPENKVNWLIELVNNLKASRRCRLSC